MDYFIRFMGNSFCNKIDVFPPASTNRVAEKLMKELKDKFPEVFSDRLGSCTKTKVWSQGKCDACFQA